MATTNITWAYGITTVPSRRDNLFPSTLKSLSLAGFPNPRVFVDGISSEDTNNYSSIVYNQGSILSTNIEITSRYPTIRTVGNWLLGIIELYIRNPNATYYAMFQDDIVTYPNLRCYLEKCSYPGKGYWNLYTVPENTKLVPLSDSKEKAIGWYLSNQLGRGALALVFDNQTLLNLLSSRSIIEKFKHAVRGWRNLDGAVLTALAKYDIKEYIHYPSLVQHTGISQSSMGTMPRVPSDCFLGESYDAIQLIPK